MNRFFLILQYLLPHHLLSRILGAFANCRWCWVKNLLMSWFIKHYKIDLTEALREDPEDYFSFNDLFTRRLKKEVRPISRKKGAIVSPVDGAISQIGILREDELLQAKGIFYSLESLLGGTKLVDTFKDGAFATLYLSPQDYHHIHMPCAGKLIETTYIPGQLFSVNNVSAENIPGIFAKNERLVCIFETACGKMAVIMVGAMLVASINTAWDGKVTPNKSKGIVTKKHKKLEYKKADDIGFFEFGSTVIVLFEKDAIAWHKDLKANQKIKMGQLLGSAKIAVR